MKFAVIASAAILSLALAAPASAELAVGAKAPDFTTRGAQGGTLMDVKLSNLLKKGPVVLYFFPAAFTAGCTAESRAFAEATDKFAAAGATILGMSADPVEKLAEFSTKECSSKFPVASAGMSIVKGFDVALRPGSDSAVTKRTSYVIAKSGEIVFVHSEMSAANHVKNTLAAVEALKKGG